MYNKILQEKIIKVIDQTFMGNFQLHYCGKNGAAKYVAYNLVSLFLYSLHLKSKNDDKGSTVDAIEAAVEAHHCKHEGLPFRARLRPREDNTHASTLALGVHLVHCWAVITAHHVVQVMVVWEPYIHQEHNRLGAYQLFIDGSHWKGVHRLLTLLWGKWTS